MLTSLEHVITVLEGAPRIGKEKDEPEGSRYIQLTETLVNEMLAVLRRELPNHREGTPPKVA